MSGKTASGRAEREEMVWAVMLLNEANRIPSAFEALDAAMRLAASYAGNNSFAHPGGDIFLWGPGDGTTSVMVRQLPREALLAEDVPIIPR